MFSMIFLASVAVAADREYLFEVYDHKRSIHIVRVPVRSEGGPDSLVFDWRNQSYKAEFRADSDGYITEMIVQKWIWIDSSSPVIIMMADIEVEEGRLFISHERWEDVMGRGSVSISLSLGLE